LDFRKEEGTRGPRYLVNGKSLVSVYDPEKEARQWAASITSGPEALVFLVGEPTGLAARELALQSGCRVVRLVPHASCLTGQDRSWCWVPEDSDLGRFLSDVLERCGPAQVQWHLWPAFERAAPQEAGEWTRVFRDTYRIAQGSWLTTKHSGRRWWRNSLRNFVGWEHPVDLQPGSRPIVVAASGPSLDAGWQVLAQERARFDLWALPSSISALRVRGLTPDVVVTTDGGYWAAEHLHRLNGAPTTVLSALSGAADAVLERSPTWFFGQGLPWENELLATLPFPAAVVPSQGTVAVTALNLALAATSGAVFVAGLDLAWTDFRAHVSGHTVDRRLAPVAGRYTPWEGLLAQRCFEQATISLGSGERTSAAMKTYALWLGTATRFSRLVHRVAPGSVRVAGMADVSWHELANHLRAASGQPVRSIARDGRTWPDRNRRRELAAAALESVGQRALDANWSWETWMKWSLAVVPDEVQLAQRSPTPARVEAVRDGLVAFLRELGATL